MRLFSGKSGILAAWYGEMRSTIILCAWAFSLLGSVLSNGLDESLMLCGKGVFQLQQAVFFVEAGGVACQGAVGAYYPVAGDDD